MFSLLTRHPFVALPAKFLGRITMGAIWGVLLSPFDSETKVALAAVLGVIAVSLFPFFVGWDRKPLSAARVSLYGVLMGGEAMAVGAMVLAALATFTGTTELLSAMVMCTFGGTVLTLYPTAIMYRDNTRERRDQQ